MTESVECARFRSCIPRVVLFPVETQLAAAPAPFSDGAASSRAVSSIITVNPPERSVQRHLMAAPDDPSTMLEWCLQPEGVTSLSARNRIAPGQWKQLYRRWHSLLQSYVQAAVRRPRPTSVRPSVPPVLRKISPVVLHTELSTSARGRSALVFFPLISVCDFSV
jgi:hypothetical protein